MKYLHYDINGLIIGYYDDTIHTDIPAPNFKITEEEWLDCINNTGMRRVDTNNNSIVVFNPPPPALADYANAACIDIDLRAGEVRDSYVSPGSLIDREYKRALDVAIQWQADGESAAAVPAAVQSWADASGMTPSVAAADIINSANSLNDALDNIRAARLAGKAAVNAATNNAAVDDAKNAALAALDELVAV